MPVAIPFIIGAIGGGLTAYDTYDTYQTEGAGAAAKSAAVGAALTAAGAGAAKAAGSIGKRIAGFFRKAPVETKRVGRHMSPDELEKMRSTGQVQEGGFGQTRVADPANSNTYRNAPEGDVYVEFDVPADRVLPHSQGTGRIPGPNSPDARIPGRNASDYEMPSADNIDEP